MLDAGSGDALHQGGERANVRARSLAPLSLHACLVGLDTVPASTRVQNGYNVPGQRMRCAPVVVS